MSAGHKRERRGTEYFQQDKFENKFAKNFQLENESQPFVQIVSLLMKMANFQILIETE